MATVLTESRCGAARQHTAAGQMPENGLLLPTSMPLAGHCQAQARLCWGTPAPPSKRPKPVNGFDVLHGRCSVPPWLQ